MRSVIYGTGAVVHDGFDVDGVAESLERDGVTLISLVTTQLVRLLEAGRGPLRAAGDPGRRRTRARSRCSRRRSAAGAAVVQTYGLTEAASQVTTLAPAGGATQARLRRAAAADHPPADPGRRDPRPGPGRRAGLRRRGRLAAHRRPGPDRRRGLPLRRGPARRRDRQRGRERAARRGRGGPAAPPRRRRRRRGRPRRCRVAGGGGGRGRAARTAPRPAPTELRRHCAESLAGYKVPKRFEFVSELPRTASGKLLRRALR